jgi:hypothetical protein
MMRNLEARKCVHLDPAGDEMAMTTFLIDRLRSHTILTPHLVPRGQTPLNISRNIIKIEDLVGVGKQISATSSAVKALARQRGSYAVNHVNSSGFLPGPHFHPWRRLRSCFMIRKLFPCSSSLKSFTTQPRNG